MKLIQRLLLITGMLLPMAAYAVGDATEAFTTAPDAVFPTINPTLRLDMLDYYKASHGHNAENDFAEPARIDTLTSDRISVRVADNAVVDMTLMPLSATDTAVVVITTLQAPATISSVKVFHGDWVEYPGVMPSQQLTDWLLPQAKERMADIENMVPFIITKMTFDPATRTLTARNTLDEYFTPDDYTKLQSLMRPALTYRWNGKKFQLLKP